MKKTSTKLCLVLLATTQLLLAQSPNTNSSDRLTQTNSVSAVQALQSSNARIGNPENETQAIFDVQFNHTLPCTAAVSCVYTGTEFWVGNYSIDSIFIFDN